MCLAVPGRVVEIRQDRTTLMGTVDFGGISKDVCLAYVPDVKVGQYAIVHVGFAIGLLDEESALETLSLLAELGELAELEADDQTGRGPGGGM